jgi:hypothetical protein
MTKQREASMSHEKIIREKLSNGPTPDALTEIGEIREKVPTKELPEFDDLLEKVLNEVRNRSNQPETKTRVPTKGEMLIVAATAVFQRLFLERVNPLAKPDSAEGKRRAAVEAIYQWIKAEKHVYDVVAEAAPDWVTQQPPDEGAKKGGTRAQPNP